MSKKFRMMTAISAAQSTPLRQGGRRKRKFSRFPDRIAYIEASLAMCVPEPQIRRQCSESWGVSQAVVGQYIAEVRYRWREDAMSAGSTDREFRRDQARMRLETTAMRALNKKNAAGTGTDPDLRAALMAQKLLMDLDGLRDTAPEVVGPNVHNTFINGINLGPTGPLGFKSPEDIRARMSELEEAFAGDKSVFHGPVGMQMPPSEEDTSDEEPADDN